MKNVLWVLILIFLASYSGNSQTKLVDEWSASIGYLNFQGDYGQRGDFSSTLGNYGATIGGKVYFNFLDSDRVMCYTCTHIKFNLALDAGYSKLSFDKAYDDAVDSYSIQKLKAFSGQIYFLNISANVEYHLSDLRNFSFFDDSFIYRLDPYFGVGVGAMAYSVDVESDLGDFETDPSILPDSFIGGIYEDPDVVPAINFELGVRYMFSDEIQFTFSNKWMYFISDKVDGLIPNESMVDNKYNDWLFTPSFGVVFFIY